MVQGTIRCKWCDRPLSYITCLVLWCSHCDITHLSTGCKLCAGMNKGRK